MSVLCGTDFSEMSARATTVAARLAACTHKPLHLLHALDIAPEELSTQPSNALVVWAERHLAREAERLRGVGASVSTHVQVGSPDEALAVAARQLSARLIVVGALGRRTGRWQLGSHADRTAQRAHVPVLVVREAEPFERWLDKTRPLRIVLGVDASLSSEAAGRWISQLSAFGPCEVVLAHLYWPPEEFHRLGLGGVRSYVDPDAEITKTLEQDYSARFAGLSSSAKVRYRIEPHLGRIGDALAAVATEEKADLVVVGSHDRSAFARVWEGSVTRQAVKSAHCSVACIPAVVERQTQKTPSVRSVLCATDFSTLGNGAIPLAYSVVDPGGTVHLVHIVKTAHDPFDAYDIFTPLPGKAFSEAQATARTRLAELIPKDAAAANISTDIHVLQSTEPATAICQAAERIGADIICLGTHGRSGLPKAVLGSVAQEVLTHTRRPVLLARAQRE